MEYLRTLKYRLHGHLAPPPPLLVRKGGVRADEDVVRLRQLDGLVHDREVAVVHTRLEEYFTMMQDSEKSSRRVEAARYVGEVDRLHEFLIVALVRRHGTHQYSPRKLKIGRTIL